MNYIVKMSVQKEDDIIELHFTFTNIIDTLDFIDSFIKSSEKLVVFITICPAVN